MASSRQILLSFVLVLFFAVSFAVAARPDWSGRVQHSEEVLKGLRPLDPAEGGMRTVGSDLRTAPSGPDPMHHHSGPKKPKTP